MRNSRYREDRDERLGRKSEQFFIRLFEKHGLVVEQNDPDRQGCPDLRVKINNAWCFFEIEGKSDKNWDFIKRGIHIPRRKEKAFRRFSNDPEKTFCLMLKEDNLEFLQIPGREVLSGNVVNKFCRDSRQYEDFFEVDYTKAKHYVRSGEKFLCL